jgi:cell division protein FtsW (lipid II flippase)
VFLLPDFLQDSFFESFVTPAIGIVILVIAYLSQKTIIIPIAVVLGMFALIVGLEVKKYYNRKKLQKFIQPVNLIDDELDKQVELAVVSKVLSNFNSPSKKEIKIKVQKEDDLMVSDIN